MVKRLLNIFLRIQLLKTVFVHIFKIHVRCCKYFWLCAWHKMFIIIWFLRGLLNHKNGPFYYKDSRRSDQTIKHSYLEVFFQEQLFRPLSGSHQAVMTDYFSVMNDRVLVRHRYPRYSCSFSVNIVFKSSDIFKLKLIHLTYRLHLKYL